VLDYWKPYPDDSRFISSNSANGKGWEYNLIDIHIIDRIESEADLEARLDGALRRAYEKVKGWSRE